LLYNIGNQELKGFILWHNIIFKLSDELKDKVKKTFRG